MREMKNLRRCSRLTVEAVGSCICEGVVTLMHLLPASPNIRPACSFSYSWRGPC
ncbi:Protein of unknown function [Pyronema omphalodes CBS 100304]|uniref:Uncharacterized protein n=1 Tax=Pyronema omphalodes (strain CBS 100304) TaxID=1076935 RepID=U4L4W6_PYROM|nr:Protein of unknown function [Pyronema omphalodes CBS 100304]